MEIHNRQSTATDLHTIISELSKDIYQSYDLGIIFSSGFSKDSALSIVQELRNHVQFTHIIGCSSIGVISTGEEREEQKACTLMLANFPDVNIIPFYLEQQNLDQAETPEKWMELIDVYPNEHPHFLFFPDPFSFEINILLENINKNYPDSVCIGGLASGSTDPKGNILFLNDNYYDAGLVGLTLSGNIEIQTIVSQGCRPIGKNFIVTKVEGNIIYELGGRPLLEVLHETLTQASSRDKILAQDAICVGIAMDEYKHRMGQGDFLIRLLIGLDQNSGAGAIADFIQSGQTIQFHLRDAISATEDLTQRMQRWSAENQGRQPSGALIVTCAGRGESLFREKKHDINIIQKHIGHIPVTGFFSSGEIGPVAGNNFVHGFTCCTVLFYPAKNTPATS